MSAYYQKPIYNLGIFYNSDSCSVIPSQIVYSKLDACQLEKFASCLLTSPPNFVGDVASSFIQKCNVQLNSVNYRKVFDYKPFVIFQSFSTPGCKVESLEIEQASRLQVCIQKFDGKRYVYASDTNNVIGNLIGIDSISSTASRLNGTCSELNQALNYNNQFNVRIMNQDIGKCLDAGNINGPTSQRWMVVWS